MTKPLFLVVIDKDKSKFAVEGPMTDDSLWVAAVSRAQEEGRQVNCHTTPSSREDIIAHFGQKYMQVSSRSLVKLEY